MQVNYSYSVLEQIMVAESFAHIELEQIACINELCITIIKILESDTDNRANDRINVSQKTMLIYRVRALAILEEIYNINGELEFVELDGEVVG